MVASPSAIGSAPEASGSSVPAWPARLAVNSRLMTLTAWVEVMPTGLSSTTQPCTSRLSRLNCCLRCFGVPRLASVARSGESGWRLGVDTRLRESPQTSSFDRSLVVVICSRSRCTAGERSSLSMRSASVEAVVDAEADVGREFQIDAVRDLGAQEFLVALERGDAPRRRRGRRAASRRSVASRRSAVMRTSGTVMRWPSITGSCTSPRVSISAMAWRTSSPTRNWRCEPPGVAVAVVFCLRHGIPNFSSSWPGLSRPSTSCIAVRG